MMDSQLKFELKVLSSFIPVSEMTKPHFSSLDVKEPKCVGCNFLGEVGSLLYCVIFYLVHLPLLFCHLDHLVSSQIKFYSLRKHPVFVIHNFS